MSGARLVLDANAIVAVLNGSDKLGGIIDKAQWIGMSVISRLEFLAYSGLTAEDEKLFAEFCGRIEIIGISPDDSELLETTTRIRREYHLKLPDAIIAATALTSGATLVTTDDDFRKVSDLGVLNPSGG